MGDPFNKMGHGDRLRGDRKAMVLAIALLGNDISLTGNLRIPS
jgi:hypothetical protein